MSAFNNLYLPLMVVALMTGCGDKKDEASTNEKPPTQVAAKVNGTELTVHQVNYTLQRIPNLDAEQSKTASLRVVRNLVEQELLVQKALEDKLDRDANVVQALDAARRQILAEAYMARKLGAPVEPTDADVSEYFDQHPELFAQRKIYRLQEIAIKVPEDKRDAVRSQLGASKSMKDFAEWLQAEKYEAKASQGVKPAEQIPQALLPQLAKMPNGQALGVNVPDGLLVIVVADSQPQPVALEQAKPAIVRKLQSDARQKAGKAELDALKTAAKIEYMGEFVDAGKEEVKPAVTPDAAAAPAEAEPDSDADAISKGISGLK